MTRKRARGNPIPLIIEEHPDDYDGYPFITLIQYRKEQFLTIVDNFDDKVVEVFVLDLCGPANVDEESVISIAERWYENHREQYPISFEFSKLGVSDQVKAIFKTFHIEFVTRVIGPMQRFEMADVQSVKRRKRKPLPSGIKVNRKVSTLVS